jgi:signal transduction histidine kinase/ligand-binding sensor domain-containing protein
MQDIDGCRAILKECKEIRRLVDLHKMHPDAEKHFRRCRSFVASLKTCKAHWFSTLCLLCACLLSAIETTAQYRFDSWTTDNGLPQGSVNSILQTSDGYIWLATFGGLVRFDGLRFQVFNTGNTKGLRSGRFLWLFEDRAGNLWINTEAQGLTRYKDGLFTTYTTENGLPSNQVWKMYEDTAGTLRAQTDVGWTQWVDGAFRPIEHNPDEPIMSGFQPSRSGGVWYREDGRLRKTENGRVLVEVNSTYYVNAFYEDHAGRIWIGTREEHLLVYENGKLTDYSQKVGFPRFRHLGFFEDRKGLFWISTGGDGLFRLKDGAFTRYTTSDGLVSNDVISLYEDREGTLWVSSKSGFSRITERAVTSYSTKDGLAADNVYAIYEDHQGKMLIGTWNGPGLTRYSNGVFTDVTQQYGLADNWVSALLEDRSGGLWIGTYASPLRYVKDGKVTKFLPKPFPVVHTIIQDRAGSIWVGCNDALLQYKDGNFTTYTAKSNVRGNDILALYEDRQSQLWIGTEAGLSKYKDGVFTNYTERDGFAGNIVRTIYEDAEGALWVGMYDSGLYRLKAERVTHYTTSEGLFDNGVFSIVEDGSGNFWISCNLGIYRVRKAELNGLAEGSTKKITSVPYNRRDGMLNAECNGGGHPAGIRAHDGRIWFPTQQGVAVIDPSRLPVNSHPPAVLVESVVVDTKPVSISSGVRLEPGQVNLEINYTGLSFISPELVKFKYKLGGLDEDWVDAGARRTAYYAHLPPGTYSFHVIAANRDGFWNEAGATMRIVVVPPFWRTRWFITGAVVALGLIVFGFYQRRILGLKRANQAQERFTQQLIDSQEGERKRIAAELHDSLGQSLLMIKNRVALGLKFWDDPAKARDQIEQIGGTVAESIKEVRQIAYDLRPYQLDHIGLSQALEELVERVSGSGPIKFTASIAAMDDLYSADAAINVYRILQEALNNIVKHSGASQASVVVTRVEREVLMEIQDNGKGFSVEASDVKGGNGTRRGFGLTGLEERARMLNGKLAVTSTPGQGTTVRLRMGAQASLPASRNGD